MKIKIKRNKVILDGKGMYWTDWLICFQSTRDSADIGKKTVSTNERDREWGDIEGENRHDLIRKELTIFEWSSTPLDQRMWLGERYLGRQKGIEKINKRNQKTRIHGEGIENMNKCFCFSARLTSYLYTLPVLT